VEQLKDTGKVTRGWLGVTIQDVNKVLAESLGLDRPKGALIVELQPGGPADRGGLKSGDVIITFDGKEIATSSDLPHVVGLARPGTEARVELVRDGRDKTIRLEVGSLGADEEPTVAGLSPEPETSGKLGLVVEEITEQLQTRWSITGGVLVTEVVSDSPADEAGIRSGDVITLLAGTPVTSVESFERIARDLKSGKSVPVRLIRRGAPLFIGLKPE
jgi:serine protease Do